LAKTVNEREGPKLMSVCPGIKRDGSRCTVSVEPPQTYCWWHDPANAEERRRAASKGGRRGERSRPQAELADAKQEIRAVIGGVLSGRIERSVGAVIFQGYNTLLKAVSTELAVREQLELIERLGRLEEALEGRKGSSRWGA
jgi:predicted RNA-binding Zn ribbon-like protein